MRAATIVVWSRSRRTSECPCFHPRLAKQNYFYPLDDHEVAAHIVEVLVALERRDDALEVLEDAESRHTDSELLQDVRDRLFPDAD